MLFIKTQFEQLHTKKVGADHVNKKSFHQINLLTAVILHFLKFTDNFMLEEKISDTLGD